MADVEPPKQTVVEKTVTAIKTFAAYTRIFLKGVEVDFGEQLSSPVMRPMMLVSLVTLASHIIVGASIDTSVRTGAVIAAAVEGFVAAKGIVRNNRGK